MKNLWLIFNTTTAVLLVCSLAFNIMIWTGKIVRYEWVQDFVTTIQPTKTMDKK